MQNVSNVIISKPISVVWDFYNNPANYTLWLSAFSHIELVEGKLGEPNSVSNFYYVYNKREMKLAETICDLIFQSKIETIQENEILKTEMQVVFEPLYASSTRIVVTTNTKFKVLTFKLLSFFLKKSFQKRLDNDFFRFKEILEASSF